MAKSDGIFNGPFSRGVEFLVNTCFEAGQINMKTTHKKIVSCGFTTPSNHTKRGWIYKKTLLFLNIKQKCCLEDAFVCYQTFIFVLPARALFIDRRNNDESSLTVVDFLRKIFLLSGLILLLWRSRHLLLFKYPQFLSKLVPKHLISKSNPRRFEGKHKPH